MRGMSENWNRSRKCGGSWEDLGAVLSNEVLLASGGNPVSDDE